VYPANYFAIFPPFPRENKVFVAMSFDPRFDSRWTNVIAPAIGDVRLGSIPLEPYRVDVRKVSDSILTDILGGITNHRLILADVTSLPVEDIRPVRNGNVMYEVGIAHAVRLPEEVIIFRSDSDPLLFDVANVRVNHYDPDGNPIGAKRVVTEAIIDALKEIDLRKSLAVKAAAEALDVQSWLELGQAAGGDGLKPPTIRTVGEALGNATRVLAISRLLEMGLLATFFPKITVEIIKSNADVIDRLFRYRATAFGIEVTKYAATKMGIFSPELQPYLESTTAGLENQSSRNSPESINKPQV
jgi:hypothetical protein